MVFINFNKGHVALIKQYDAPDRFVLPVVWGITDSCGSTIPVSGSPIGVEKARKSS